MAVIYLRSTDGSDSDNGSTWALAKATLAAALTAAGAGGTVYVSQSHAETHAEQMTLESPGKAGSATRVACVADSAEPPVSLASTATVSTSVGGTGNISFTGHVYYYGITFTAGNNSTDSASIRIIPASGDAETIFDHCNLVIASTSSSSRIYLGNSSNAIPSTVILNNTTVQFNNTDQSIVLGRSIIRWNNTPSAIQGAAIPTSLISSATLSTFTANGVDLSASGAGKNLLVPSIAPQFFSFSNCRLGSSVSVLSTSISRPGGTEVYIDNCDSSDTNYRMEHYKYQGSIKTETSKIRSGGASDGTTPISWNMTTLAGSSFVSPLESPPISIWNETTGSSKTVTVEIAQDSAATALDDDEIWMEVEYLGTPGYPVSSIASDRKPTILATSLAQTTSSVTWNNMTTPTKQKLEVSFTPQGRGLFTARVMLAKPSVTVYVDPLLTVS